MSLAEEMDYLSCFPEVTRCFFHLLSTFPRVGLEKEDQIHLLCEHEGPGKQISTQQKEKLSNSSV